MTHTLTGTVHQLVSGEEGFEYENECNTPRSINGFRKKKKITTTWHVDIAGSVGYITVFF